MRTLGDDVRLAFRRLRQQPGFTSVGVLTLALGLGANTAIFTLIHAVMMRPLPVTRPSELYRLGAGTNCCVNSGLQRDYSLFSYPLYAHLRDELSEFSDLAAFQANTIVTGIRPPGGGPARPISAMYVSGNYFRMLGIGAGAGRLIDIRDDEPGAPPVMVLSYRTWTEQFGADAALIGQAFVINGTAVTLVGVAPRDFFGETVRPNPAGIWLPVGAEPVIRGAAASLVSRPGQDWLYAIGRLARAAAPDRVSSHATQALQSWLGDQSFLSDRDRSQLPQQRILVTSAEGGVQIMRGNFGQSLTLLFVLSAFVLLIAAANLANLQLARADRAQAAVRAALGASSARLVRQSLTEGVTLALVGCAGAFVVGVVAARAIIALAFPPGTVLPIDVLPSPAIVVFSIALAIVTGTMFAAAPAWAMARTNPIDALRGLSRQGADVAFMPRRSLTIVQVSLSLVLLTGAGLLGRSLSLLQSQPLGFETDRRIVVYIDPPALAGEPDRLAALYDAMQRRLEQIPGIERMTYSLYSPMEGNNWSSGVAIGGRPFDPERRDSSSWNRVGPGYFETLGTTIVRGRGITAADTPTAAHVAVVNQAFVEKFLQNVDPIGGTVGIGDAPHAGDFAIVGVAADVKYRNANRPTLPMIFLPVMQLAKYDTLGERQVQARSTLARTIELQVAASGATMEPAIRRVLSEVHPDLMVTRIIAMADQVNGNFRADRLMATLVAAYGVLALALASLGLYGVTAYGVSRRQHEIGIRMALGADRGRIVRAVLRGALIQVAIGLAIGVPLALAGGGALSDRLFAVSGRDPLVVGVASLALVIAAAAAAVLPARRAASVDPTRALRSM